MFAGICTDLHNSINAGLEPYRHYRLFVSGARHALQVLLLVPAPSSEGPLNNSRGDSSVVVPTLKAYNKCIHVGHTDQANPHDFLHAVAHELHSMLFSQELHPPVHKCLVSRHKYRCQLDASLEVQEGSLQESHSEFQGMPDSFNTSSNARGNEHEADEGLHALCGSCC